MNAEILNMHGGTYMTPRILDSRDLPNDHQLKCMQWELTQLVFKTKTRTSIAGRSVQIMRLVSNPASHSTKAPRT